MSENKFLFHYKKLLYLQTDNKAQAVHGAMLINVFSLVFWRKHKQWRLSKCNINEIISYSSYTLKENNNTEAVICDNCVFGWLFDSLSDYFCTWDSRFI